MSGKRAPLYCAHATLLLPLSIQSIGRLEQDKRAHAVFYVYAQDDAYAGARFQDLVRELGFTFDAYVAVPTAIPPLDEGADAVRALEAAGECLILRIPD